MPSDTGGGSDEGQNAEIQNLATSAGLTLNLVGVQANGSAWCGHAYRLFTRTGTTLAAAVCVNVANTTEYLVRNKSTASGRIITYRYQVRSRSSFCMPGLCIDTDYNR